MAKLAKLKATIGTANYIFQSTAGVYDGGISLATGIAVAGEDDQDEPNYPVKELLLKGVLRRVNAVVQTTGGQRRTLKLLIAEDKLATALDELRGDSVSIPGGLTGTIRSVGFSRRVVGRG